MNREEAIKTLHELWRETNDPWYEEVYDMAIEALSAEAVQGWIPVSERLPEKDGSYLVCMRWDYHSMDVLIWADGWNCIRLINDKVDRKSEIDGEEITAWMPLPPVYQGE